MDVTVIGAGQAGLSVAHHLRLRGIDGSRLRVVDAEEGPGGAWRHRWPTLTVERLNGIFALPEQQQDPVDPHAPAREAVPAWFATYERRQGLDVLRPVTVESVHDHPAGDGRLLVRSSVGRWATRAVVSCTGTWTRPHWPWVPGMRDFAGRQLHTHDYPGPAPFADRRVVVVGAGISGAGHVVELAGTASSVRWVTRRPPDWRAAEFTAEHGRAVIDRVQARVRDGLRTRSVVAETGLALRGRLAAARRDGVLRAHPMFDRLDEEGPVWDRAVDHGWDHSVAAGERWAAEVVLWATGFRPAVDHLAPLRLRTRRGGIRVEGTLALDDHRVHLVGYGPSASTVGANRYGRDAAIALSRWLGGAR